MNWLQKASKFFILYDLSKDTNFIHRNQNIHCTSNFKSKYICNSNCKDFLFIQFNSIVVGMIVNAFLQKFNL